MDRFNESPFPAARFDQDEDGFPVPPAVELPRCECCGQPCAELARDWDGLLVGACCLDAREPECQCECSGDLFDPAGCELHNSQSAWNVARRSVGSVQQYERYISQSEEIA